MSRESLLYPPVVTALFLCATASSQTAQAQVGCSAYDQQLIASYTQQLMTAAMQGNTGSIAQLSQRLQGSLSPACLQQLQSYQGGYGGYNGYYPSPGGMPGGVIDHGNGGYSYGNVYCEPCGCDGP